jgi:hypothetical protein
MTPVEKLYHDVGFFRQRQRDIAAGPRLQVEYDARLVAIDPQMGSAFPVAVRRILPKSIAAFGRFDLDNVRAEITEYHGTERPGNEMRKVDDTQFGQRRFGSNITHLVDSSQNGSITRLRVVRGAGTGRVSSVLIRISRVSAGSITSS